METSLMSESLVVACDLEETVAEVLTQLVQDGGEMPVELLQEQVELHLEYSEGSLSNWQNFLTSRLRDFFKYKNPESVNTALIWASKPPQPDVVPRYRPPKVMVWNATGNPILNDSGSVTGYDDGWVYVNPGDDPDVQPAGRPNYRPPKGKEWNGKATAITNEGVLTAYTGAWVDADAEDASSDVQPASRPNYRPPKVKEWNRSERLKLIPGQEFLSKIDVGTVRAEWVIIKKSFSSRKNRRSCQMRRSTNLSRKITQFC